MQKQKAERYKGNRVKRDITDVQVTKNENATDVYENYATLQLILVPRPFTGTGDF
ncbi:hypothetical protein [Dyadobacter sandarakinus]|uniref:Uncharacterized protein n=1 Tax=Dyadobacter sandarakinus TaxID=2747268 RepID=A0ABX7I5E9_9BACT|nr:hypothetical protein [Dyadobacter sandarakinus]QRR00717.1 hypothetical protein HWI92_07265 [Dyadobacter sandarakinus]